MFAKLVDKIISVASRTPKKRRLVKYAAFLLIVSPIVLTSIFSYVKTKQDLTDFILSRRESIAQLAALSLEGRFDRLVDVGISLATRVQFRRLIQEGKWEEAIKILESAPTDFPYIDTVAIFDPQGIVRAVTPLTPPIREVIGKSFAHRDYYKGVSKDWQPYVSEVFKRDVEPKYNVVSVAIPIKSGSVEGADKRILGIVLLTIELDTILDWAREVEVGAGGFTYFVDRNGHVAGHPKFSSYGEVVDFSEVPVVKKVLEGESGVEIMFNPVEKEEQVAAYYATVKKYGWGAIAQQPVLTAFASRGQYLRFLLVIYGAIFLIHSLLAYVIVHLGDTIFEDRMKEKTLLESVGDGVIAIDRQWNIIAWNKAAATLTGWSKEEALGKPFRTIVKLLRERDRKENITFIEETMLFGESRPMENNTLLIRKDGSEFYVGDMAAPILGNNGKAAGAIIIFRDVSKEKELEKMRDEFSSLATHQLRNPVTVIKGYSQMLLEAGGLAKEQKSNLEAIRQAANSLSELVNAMLNVSRIELGSFAINPEPAYLSDIADEVLKEISPQVEKKKLNISKNYDKSLPSLNIDIKLMQAVFRNLLSNAVKYTPKNGRIELGIQKQDKDILVRISDTGYGIPKDQQSKVFSRFFRGENIVEKEPEGTGLGLYIVKSIIEQSGGKIWFESKENKGTTFYVTIPLEGMKRKEGVKGLT